MQLTRRHQIEEESCFRDEDEPGLRSPGKVSVDEARVRGGLALLTWDAGVLLSQIVMLWDCMYVTSLRLIVVSRSVDLQPLLVGAISS